MEKRKENCRQKTKWVINWIIPIEFAITMSISVGITAAVFIGISALMSMSVTRMPESINIPNREYWLNDVNRLKTIRRLCSSCEMIGVGTMFFLLNIQWITFCANQTAPPNLDVLMLMCAVGVFGIFVAYIVFDQVCLYRSFCRLPEDGEPQEPQV